MYMIEAQMIEEKIRNVSLIVNFSVINYVCFKYLFKDFFYLKNYNMISSMKQFFIKFGKRYDMIEKKKNFRRNR